MTKKKTTLKEAQKQYYFWLRKEHFNEETAKQIAFRTEKEIDEYEKKVLALIDEMHGKFPKTAEAEKLAFKNMDCIYKLEAMHYRTPKEFVDLLFL